MMTVKMTWFYQFKKKKIRWRVTPRFLKYCFIYYWSSNFDFFALEYWQKDINWRNLVYIIVCLFRYGTKPIASAFANKLKHVQVKKPLKFGVTRFANVYVKTYWCSNARLPEMVRFWGPTHVTVFAHQNCALKGKWLIQETVNARFEKI